MYDSDVGFQRQHLTAKDMMMNFHLNDHWQNYYDHSVSRIILKKSVRIKVTNLHHYHHHHHSYYFIPIIISNTIIIIIIIRVSYERTFSSGLIFTAFIVPLWPLPEATETPEKKEEKKPLKYLSMIKNEMSQWCRQMKDSMRRHKKSRGHELSK